MVTAIQLYYSDDDSDSISSGSKGNQCSDGAQSKDTESSRRCSAIGQSSVQKEEPPKKETPKRSRKNLRTTQTQRRRSRRNATGPVLEDLARHIVSSKAVVFITGAGLSAASGIRTFRGPDGLWSEVIWKKATREEFRKDPLRWYNEFWVSVCRCLYSQCIKNAMLHFLTLIHCARTQLKHFPPHTYGDFYKPNDGHEAIATLASLPNANIKVITQNIDGLHCRTTRTWNHQEQLIESHGRLGYYKCIPAENLDSDSDSDEDNIIHQRSIYLGNRRKKQRQADSSDTGKPAQCRYEFLESIPAHEIIPAEVGATLSGVCNEDGKVQHSVDSDYALALELHNYINGHASDNARHRNQSMVPLQRERILIKEPPKCPACRRPVLPQALQFDESYHSHSHYQFECMEDWIDFASVIVFVGTSFEVTLTQHALDHARKEKKIVYNFNIDVDVLGNTSWINVENVIGDVQVTLPELVRLCEKEIAAQIK